MKEKMHTGELYLPADEDIVKEQVVYQDRLCEYNLTKPSEAEKGQRCLKKCLEAVARVCILKRLFTQILEDTTAILGIWFMQIII